MKISENKGLCEKWMNQYPTVFVTFKEIDGLEFSPAYERLQGELAELFMKLKYLLNSGKVNPEDKQIALRIPNAEAMDIFRKSVVEWFTKKTVNSDRRGLFDSLWSGDTEKLTELLSDLLFDTISYHDYAESFYHAFLTGLVTSGGYIVESNYENGLGRSDLVIKDRRNRRGCSNRGKDSFL